MSKYVSRRQPPKLCPHCRREFTLTGGNFARHVSHCLQDPAAFALNRAALDDGSGCIRGMGVYQVARHGGLSRNALLAQVGGGWDDVAAFFGLQQRDKTLTPTQVRAREAAQVAAQVQAHDEMAAWAAEDAAEYDAAQAARLPSGLPVARVVVEERVYTGGDGWGVRVREERYLLR